MREKWLLLQKSGSGGQSLTELDNLVLDVVGRESAFMKGINNKSGLPSFAKTSKPSQTSDQNSTLMSDLSMDSNSNNGNAVMNDSFASNYSQFEPDNGKESLL